MWPPVAFDARDVPGLPGIPPIEHDKAWVIVEELCVKVIDEVRGAEDAHNHYHTDAVPQISRPPLRLCSPRCFP